MKIKRNPQFLTKVFRHLNANEMVLNVLKTSFFKTLNATVKPGAQLGGTGGGLPCPFFKIEKVPWFKKSPWFCLSWVKFSIQGVVLRVSRRKNSQIFPCLAFCFFWFFFKNKNTKVPWFHKSSPVLKNFWLQAWKLEFIEAL